MKILLFILLTIAKVHASPDIKKAFMGVPFPLRLSTINVGFDENFDGGEKFINNDLADRFEEVLPCALIKWGTAYLYKTGPKCDTESWKEDWDRWFIKSDWVTEFPNEPVGLAPALVVIIPDSKDAGSVWILHLWEKRAVLYVGISCGEGIYQERPDTKKTQGSGRDFVSRMWKTANQAIGK
jgi:hypothetical protein